MEGKLMSQVCLFIILFKIVISCGVTNYDRNLRRGKRIVGGINSFGWKYSWYGVLVTVRGDEMKCGASLITLRHLLTAAHCYDGAIYGGIKYHKYYDVHLGVYNICRHESRKQIYKPVKVTINKYYFKKTSSILGDIAIIHLKADVPYYYVPICLPDLDSVNQSTSIVNVIGFGLIDSTMSEIVCVLRETEVKIFHSTNCYNIYTNFNDTLCSGIYEGGVDACQGDSGGPLQIRNFQGIHFIVGIVSHGFGCGLRKNPGIYTSILFFLKWIKQNIYEENL